MFFVATALFSSIAAAQLLNSTTPAAAPTVAAYNVTVLTCTVTECALGVCSTKTVCPTLTPPLVTVTPCPACAVKVQPCTSCKLVSSLSTFISTSAGKPVTVVSPCVSYAKPNGAAATCDGAGCKTPKATEAAAGSPKANKYNTVAAGESSPVVQGGVIKTGVSAGAVVLMAGVAMVL